MNTRDLAPDDFEKLPWGLGTDKRDFDLLKARVENLERQVEEMRCDGGSAMLTRKAVARAIAMFIKGTACTAELDLLCGAGDVADKAFDAVAELREMVAEERAAVR